MSLLSGGFYQQLLRQVTHKTLAGAVILGLNVCAPAVPSSAWADDTIMLYLSSGELSPPSSEHLSIPADGQALDETAPNDYQQDDPLEGFNRVMFEFNMALDKVFLQQAAFMYRTVVPEFVRDRVHDFLGNLAQPLTTVNYALQGDGDQFIDSLARFLFNTIFGFGGIIDVASEINLKVEHQTYDYTLGHWGVESGPYIMLPVLGPTTARGILGTVAEFLTDPATMWARRHNHADYTLYRGGIGAIDKRSRNYQQWDQLEDDSLDFYATIRSLYFQNTLAEIVDGGDQNKSDTELDTIETPLPNYL